MLALVSLFVYVYYAEPRPVSEQSVKPVCIVFHCSFILWFFSPNVLFQLRSKKKFISKFQNGPWTVWKSSEVTFWSAIWKCHASVEPTYLSISIRAVLALSYFKFPSACWTLFTLLLFQCVQWHAWESSEILLAECWNFCHCFLNAAWVVQLGRKMRTISWAKASILFLIVSYVNCRCMI